MDAIIATFEENGVLVGQPGTIAQGTAALREAFAGFMAINPQITVHAHEVIQAGDIALHSSTWTMRGEAPGGGHPIEETGFSTVVLRRQDNGQGPLQSGPCVFSRCLNAMTCQPDCVRAAAWVFAHMGAQIEPVLCQKRAILSAVQTRIIH